jgi:hypothetical protein
MQVKSCTPPVPQLKAPAGICIVFWPCTTGGVLKWKVIVVFPFDNVAVFAGVPFTMKSLPCTVVGSAASLRLTVKSVGAVPTTMRPQVMLVAEQPVGVGPYLPPVFMLLPPHTTISLAVHTAV